MKHLKRAIPVVLALVMAFALSISAWAYTVENRTLECETYVTITYDRESDASDLTTDKLNAAVAAAQQPNYSLTSVKVDGGNFTLSTSTGSYVPVYVTGGKLTIKNCTVGSIFVSDGELIVEDTATTGNIEISSDAVVTVRGTTGTITHEGARLLTLGGNLNHTVNVNGNGNVTVAENAVGTNTINVSNGNHTITSNSNKTELNVTGGNVSAAGDFASISVSDSGTLEMADTSNNAATVKQNTISMSGGTVKLYTDLTIKLTGNSGSAGPNIHFEKTGLTATVISDTASTTVGTVIGTNTTETLIVKSGAVTAAGELDVVTLEGGSLSQADGSTISSLEVKGGEATLDETVTTLNVSGGSASIYESGVGAVTVSGTGNVTTATESTVASLNVKGGTVEVNGGVTGNSITQSGGALTVKKNNLTVNGTGGNLVVNYTGAGEPVTATGNFTAVTVESGTLNMNATAATLRLQGGELVLSDDAAVKLEVPAGVLGSPKTAAISFASDASGKTATVTGSVGNYATVTVVGDENTAKNNLTIQNIALGDTDSAVKTSKYLKTVTVGAGGWLTQDTDSNIETLTTSVGTSGKPFSVTGTVGKLNVNGGETNVAGTATVTEAVVNAGAKLTQAASAPGKKIGTLTVNGDGGTAEISGTVTTLNVAGGNVTVKSETGDVGTATVNSGKLTQEADASIGTANVENGTAELSGTVTTLNVAGGTTEQKAGTITTAKVTAGKLTQDTGASIDTANVENGTAEFSGSVTTELNLSGGTVEQKAGSIATANVSAGTLTLSKSTESNSTVTTLNISDTGKVFITGSKATAGTTNLNGGELTLDADNTKEYTVIGAGGSLTVNKAKEVYAYGTFGSIASNAGKMYLGYSNETTLAMTSDETPVKINTTVNNGLTITNGSKVIAGMATNTTHTITIDNKAGHGSKIVNITGNGSKLTLLDGAIVTHSFDSVDLASADKFTGADSVERIVAVNVGSGVSGQKATMTIDGGKVETIIKNQLSSQLSAIMVQSGSALDFVKGELYTADLGDNGRGIDNYGTVTLGTVDVVEAEKTGTNSTYVIPVVITMGGGGTAVYNYNDKATANIYDANINVSGAGAGIVALSTSKLNIKAGEENSAIATMPTETVKVYVPNGSALNLGSKVKWSIRGGYNTSYFEGSAAAVIDGQSSDITTLQLEKNLTGARFVSTAAMDVANAEKSLPDNHYLRQNSETANTDVSVVDAAWEIQFFMENSFETIANSGYGNTTVWAVKPVGIDEDKSGTYTMNTDIDLSKNTEGWGAVASSDKTITPVAELRVIDLNNHTLKSTANVIAIDKYGDKLDDLTVQDTSTEAGGKLEAIDNVSAVTASEGKLTVAGGTVTASGTAATITATAGTINVEGGTVKQTGATSAITASGTAAITVGGGTVSAKGTDGTIAVTAGSATVTVTGGTVEGTGTNSVAIKNAGTGLVKVDAKADVTISGNGGAINTTDANANVEIENSESYNVTITGNVDAAGTVTIENGTKTTYDGNDYYSGGCSIRITGDVTGKNVTVYNYSVPEVEGDASVLPTAIYVSGKLQSTEAASETGVTIHNYVDAVVDLDVIDTTPTAATGNGGAVTINNHANGTIGIDHIDASKNGGTSDGAVKIDNGTIKTENGKTVYNNTGEVNVWATGEPVDAITCGALTVTNNAKSVTTKTKVDEEEYTSKTEGGRISFQGVGTGKVGVVASGNVGIDNNANGIISLDGLTVSSDSVTVAIDNNANGWITADDITANNTGAVTITNKLDGQIFTKKITGSGTGALTVKNCNAAVTGAESYNGTISIEKIDRESGDVTIVNGFAATCTSNIKVGASEGLQFVPGAVNGKSVSITNHSTDLTHVDEDDSSKTYTVLAIETGSVTAETNNVAINNSSAGTIKVAGTVTGKADVAAPAAKAVAITNEKTGKIEITVDVKTTTDSTGSVSIANSDNGTVTVGGAVTAGGTTTYGDVTITNGSESAETAKTGEVAVTGAVTGKTVAITNYSTDANAVKTGKVTAYGTTGESPNAYGVAILNSAKAGATGKITIDAASATAIESKGGNVIVTNEANSTLTVKGITASNGKSTPTFYDVTITNGVQDAETAATGEIDITEAITGKDVKLTNYASVKTENDAPVVGTGTITLSKVLTASGAVTIDNKASGIINTKAVGAGTNAVTITNGDASTDRGYINLDGAVTSGALTMTNNASVLTIGEAATKQTVPNTGTIKVTGDITASVDSTITNKDAGKIITAKISTTGSAKLDIVNEENGTIEIEPASAENAIAINTANGNLTIVNGGYKVTETYTANTDVTGKITITATGTGSKAINAAGAVDVKNMSNGEITTGAIEAAGATTIDNTADGVITIAATGDGVDGVKVTDASLNIGSGASDGTITITAAKGNGVNFTGNGDLTIEAGTITGNSYIVNNVTTSAYGLNVGTGTGTINLAGNDLAASSATYNSVKIDRTDGIYKSIKTDTPNGYDWAKTNGTTTTLLPRTAKNYLADGATSKTDVRKIWDVDANGYRYTVQQVTSHSLDISASSAKMKAGDTKDVTFTLTVNGTKFSNQPAYVSSATVVESSVASATSTNNATWTITKTTGQADAATATVKFMDAYDTDVHGDMATFAVEAYVAPAPAPAPSPSPAPAAPAATPTVSLSGDDNSVSIGVTTKGGTATMSEPKAADLQKVIGAGVETGEVVIDMSKLSSSIDTATVPTKTFDAIEAAVTDASNDADELTIKLPGSSVTFNAAALDAIADQATGSSISLEVSKDTVSKLATAQQNAVKALDVQDVYSITLTSGNKTISDFQGGSATVSVSYTLKAGQNAKGIVVWYVANDGTLTEVPATFSAGKVTFTVSHFSNYVIAYDAERAAACPQDSTCPIAAFSDADAKAWYHDGVHWALENGAMSGMGNGTFAPNGTTTRAMVAQILWNLEGKPAYVGMSEYTDVDNDDWFGPAVRWASAEGIVTGYDGKFAPNDPVTREQLATMLYRYAQYKNIDVSVGEDTNILSYEDAFNVNTWAMAAMQWACGAGVMNGAEVNGTMYLQPQNNATRAVVATMIARFCTEVAK